MQEIKEYFNPEDLRRILKISRATAYKIVKSGKLRVFRIGRLVRIRPDDLRQFVEGKSSKEKSKEET
jgi:putative molybdopterin biosynthesis protein